MFDEQYMTRAVELAERGQGRVEPNPMVGCVIVRDGQVVGEGWHRQFGGPHAELEALSVAGALAQGATLYTTLEPCCHHGKTPPCTDAIIRAGVRRVVVAVEDPFAKVAGRGMAALVAAGVEVEVGLLREAARRVLAPYLKLVTAGVPWMIAKWAMTLDGKIATRSGQSRWISSEASRAVVHQLRGRVDAIMVGRGTAQADDPLLTARPPGPRVATRMVVDSLASLASMSQLVRTARDVPVLVAVSQQAPEVDRVRLVDAGCKVVQCPGASHDERLAWLLRDLGRRQMTNVLVEGGGKLLGALFNGRALDEVHVFIAPTLIGGASAPGPVGGQGLASIVAAVRLDEPRIETLGGDVYLHGRVVRGAT